MEIPVKLEAFEGPLDLLLHLIDKNKINIYDIPIVTITDQYIAYINQMEQADLDSMSEFLLMAATLLDIKCRMLLPKIPTEEEEELDPRAELVEQLRQYKMFKYISKELREREQMTGDRLTHASRLPSEVSSHIEPVDTDAVLSDVTLRRLQEIFRDVLRSSQDKIDPIRSRFGRIEREKVSLNDKMNDVASFAKTHPVFSFRELLSGQKSRVQIVVTFLAVLELIKGGGLMVSQEELFGDIRIRTAADMETVLQNMKNTEETQETKGTAEHDD